MFKKLAALGAALMLCFSLAGCGSTGKDITVDVNALASELKDGVTWQDTLEEIDPNVLSMMSDYDIEGVEKSVVYLGSGATAEEITVLECTDVDAAKNQVEPAMKQHIENQITSFESYVPAEVAKLKDAVIRVGGKYVAVCVSDDSAAAEKIIDQYFK